MNNRKWTENRNWMEKNVELCSADMLKNARECRILFPSPTLVGEWKLQKNGNKKNRYYRNLQLERKHLIPYDIVFKMRGNKVLNTKVFVIFQNSFQIIFNLPRFQIGPKGINKFLLAPYRFIAPWRFLTAYILPRKFNLRFIIKDVELTSIFTAIKNS